MILRMRRGVVWMLLVLAVLLVSCLGRVIGGDADGRLPHRILLDTDVNSDDIFALLYLLKLNRSEFNLEV